MNELPLCPGAWRRSLAGWAARLRSRFRPINLRDSFQTFKEVLASNNHALEVITDMGEKLDGSYIFDVHYVQKAYADLRQSLLSSLDRFNHLTGGRYAISAVFDRIDSLIREMIEDYGPNRTLPLLFLEAVQWDLAREVGGKNAHLAELRNELSLRVPDAFVLTVGAYDAFIGAQPELATLIARGQNLTEPLTSWSARVREKILAAPFPAEIEEKVAQAVAVFRRRHGSAARVAVRSSAEEEDQLFSYAGQFETVLNVPLDSEAILAACRRVYASLFTLEALAYQQRLGHVPGGLRMAVGCMLQVEAVVSGVTYTADPVSGDQNLLLVNAAWGLGTSVVDGTTGVDQYRLRKDTLAVIDRRLGGQERMSVAVPNGAGIRTVPVSADKHGQPCLDQARLQEIAARALEIEKNYRLPQDIEWAVSREGRLYILQARPLRISHPLTGPSPAGDRRPSSAPPPLRLKRSGEVVQTGVAAGKAFVVRHSAELDAFPRGAILVAHSDSPQFIRVLPVVAAIITDTGSLASHMASVCREFKVPTVVNCGDATRRIRHGQEITVDAEDAEQAVILPGLVRSLADRASQARKMEELYEYRRRKYILRYISPLNLINPLEDDFTPGKCRTVHDVLRFIHEKSVQELIQLSSRGPGRSTMIQLELPVPAGIHIVDIGGGIAAGATTVTGKEIRSAPFAAFLDGLTNPRAWHTQAVPMGVRDLVGSLARISELATGAAGYAENNIAVISQEYMNLNLRFGYHFTLVDSFCSERPANNHIYFRFAGGATDLSKRSRRIELIGIVLTESGFLCSSKGDLMVARLSHLGQEEIRQALTMLGALIAYTRQLDALLTNDGQVRALAEKFLAGDYSLP